MKRLISIIFLCLLIMKTVGYFAYLKVQQYILKEEAKEKIIQSLPAEKLVELHFSKTDFKIIKWEEAGKEFVFEGKMYDLVRIQFDGRNYTLFCFSDEEESTIYQEIISFTQNDDLPLKKSLASCFHLLLLKFIAPEILYFKKLSYNNQSHNCFNRLTQLYSSIPKVLFIPPPEL
jgi:hypothetical protein